MDRESESQASSAPPPAYSGSLAAGRRQRAPARLQESNAPSTARTGSSPSPLPPAPSPSPLPLAVLPSSRRSTVTSPAGWYHPCVVRWPPPARVVLLPFLPSCVCASIGLLLSHHLNFELMYACGDGLMHPTLVQIMDTPDGCLCVLFLFSSLKRLINTLEKICQLVERNVVYTRKD